MSKKVSPCVLRPSQEAARLAIGYMLLCSLYILLSSHAVAYIANDLVEIEGFETAKGLAFVVISGLVFFLFAKAVFQRIDTKESEMLLRENLLIEAERKAMASMFASSVAHDMNNILTIAGYGVSSLAEPISPEARKDMAAMTEQALREMASLSNRLMTLGDDKHADDFKMVDLLETVHGSVDVARLHIRIRSCDVSISGPSGITLVASPRLIATALLNLLLNAADSMNGRGQIEIRITRGQDNAPMIEVDDNGPGIAPEIQDRLFTAFATNKPNGTGLGLLSVKGVAEAHNGSVVLVPSKLGGACFRIKFPA
jgi:two-component system sensor histidine kinase HydH